MSKKEIVPWAFETYFLFHFIMAHELPPHLLKLFAPRPTLTYWEPLDDEKSSQKSFEYSGVASLLHDFQVYCSEAEKNRSNDSKVPQYLSKLIKRKEKRKDYISSLRQQMVEWNPAKDEKIDGDAYNTLFVCKLVSWKLPPYLRNTHFHLPSQYSIRK